MKRRKIDTKYKEIIETANLLINKHYNEIIKNNLILEMKTYKNKYLALQNELNFENKDLLIIDLKREIEELKSKKINKEEKNDISFEIIEELRKENKKLKEEMMRIKENKNEDRRIENDSKDDGNVENNVKYFNEEFNNKINELESLNAELVKENLDIKNYFSKKIVSFEKNIYELNCVLENERENHKKNKFEMEMKMKNKEKEIEEMLKFYKKVQESIENESKNKKLNDEEIIKKQTNESVNNKESIENKFKNNDYFKNEESNKNIIKEYYLLLERYKLLLKKSNDLESTLKIIEIEDFECKKRRESLKSLETEMKKKEEELKKENIEIEKLYKERYYAANYHKRNYIRLKEDYDFLSNENTKLKSELKKINESVENYKKEIKKINNELENTKDDVNMLKKIAEKALKGENTDITNINKYRKLLRCSVCDTNYKDTTIIKCMHVFCRDCVDNRIKMRNRKCPVCGENFNTNDIKKIYL